MARLRPKPNSSPDDVAFGINPCQVAIEAGLARSLMIAREQSNPRLAKLAEDARAAGVAVAEAEGPRLDELSGGGVHQGALVRLKPIPMLDLRTAVSEAGERSLVLLLDSVTDPQNVGAVIRTSVAVGVDAVVLPARRGALLTPGVHRASAGLSLVAPVAAPTNLSQALHILKDAGYWVVAADAGEESLDATAFDWPRRAALILGSEGKGIAHQLLVLSDFRVALPMDPRVESLNVGVAAGALSYLYRRQWPISPASGAS